METLLKVLIPKDADLQQKSQIISSLAQNCTSTDNARLFAAICRQFGDAGEHLKALVTQKIEIITSDSSSILSELIKEMQDDARILIYAHLESEIKAASDDTYRIDELLELTYSISLEDGMAIPSSFIDYLWTMVTGEEDSTVNLISRIFNLKPFDGSNVSQWFTFIEKRIINNSFSDVPAYKCWVSWLSKGPRKGLEPYFQTTDYWTLVQRGITRIPRSTERIKYSLNILELTLKPLNENIDLDIMKWDPHSKACKSLWTRYAALVEIISVDLSYNQAEESREDVVALCQASEFIPASWALALLQSGLTTQAENIRNFIVQTIFQFHTFQLFNSDTGFLVQYLLPLASESSRFNVKDEVECEYIDELSKLVLQITRDLRPQQRALFLSQLLDYYQTQVYAYDLPRAVILEAILSYPMCYEDNSVPSKLANYANSARRVSKSQAIGQLLFDVCLKGLGSLGLDDMLDMIPKFFTTTSLYYRIDLVVPTIENSKNAQTKLQVLAREKAIFYIIHDKMTRLHGWDSLHIDSFSEPVPVFLYNQSHSAEASLESYATLEFQETGYFKQDTFKALVLLGREFPRLSTSASGLEEAVGRAQLGRLAALVAPESNQMSSLFEELEKKEFNAGYMSSEQRSLNAQRIQYIVDSIPPSTDLTSKEISLLEAAFSHDFADTQMSVLRCLNRFLDSKVAVDLPCLAEAMASMWEFLTEKGLKATARRMHVAFVNVSLHSRMVQGTGDALESVVSDIISNCHARKGLLCPLLRNFYDKKSQKFPLWVSSVLVKAYTLIRTRHDVFYLEDILMHRYLDHSPMNAGLWHENERHARVLAIKTLMAQDDTESTANMLLDEEAYHLFTPVNSHDGVEENKRILCFQVLVLLQKNCSTAFLQHLLPQLVLSVDLEVSKLIRIYIEWLISSLVLRCPDLLDKVILSPLKNSQEPRFVSSLGRAGLLVAKALGDMLPSYFITKYVNVVVPLATSNKAAVRHFSVAMIYAIYLDSALRSKLPVQLQEVVSGIAQCAEGSDQFKNFKQGDDCIWNIETDLNILGVCGGVISKLYCYDPHYTITRDEFEFKDYTLEVPKIDNNLSKFAAMTTIRDNVLTDNIQTKAGTDQEAERTELIVVASLCDIPVNLGGICRLSDALGVKMLTLNDLSVTKNNQFKSTCVTADLWQPMTQVKEEEIIDYLLEQKKNGYTLIGLEQTDNSRILRPNLKFPAKSLLLIGRERLGIPGKLLVHLDFCVEIEQWGMVRSMNVQTATAVIVHAYNNQH